MGLTSNDDKVSSIISFLDEAAASSESQNFVPRTFKDYKIDFEQFRDLIEKKVSPPSTPKKPSGVKKTSEINTPENSSRSTLSFNKKTPKPNWNNNTTAAVGTSIVF